MTGRARRVVVMVVATMAAVVAVPGLASAKSGEHESNRAAVYTLSNATAGNAVLAFKRGRDGSLTAAGSTPSGGLGTGGGLGSQGAVILSKDGRTLFTVNAGSDSVSSFAVRRSGLRLVDTADSGGDLPTSLTYSQGTLYVLNTGSPNSISGFSVHRNGDLTPLPRSTRPLSAASTNPAQVEFSPDGNVLVVSERATDLLTSYVVDRMGSPVRRPRTPRPARRRSALRSQSAATSSSRMRPRRAPRPTRSREMGASPRSRRSPPARQPPAGRS